MAVEDIEIFQIRIFITSVWAIYLNKVLYNKILKGGITACYESWFYEYP